MTKKNFDTDSAASKFFTHGAEDKHDMYDTHDTHDKYDNHDNQPQRGRPKKAPGEKKRGFRYSLTLDADLNQFLHEIAWQKRTSMTQYMNDLIRREKENYIAECEAQGKDPYEGWENWDEA